ALRGAARDFALESPFAEAAREHLRHLHVIFDDQHSHGVTAYQPRSAADRVHRILIFRRARSCRAHGSDWRTRGSRGSRRLVLLCSQEEHAMPTEFVPAKDASSFRRIAAAMWKHPSDPTIYGSMDLDVTDTLRYIDEFRRATG